MNDRLSDPTAPAPAWAGHADWLARQCEGLPGVDSGVLVLGPPEVGPFAPVAFWPPGALGAPRLVEAAERALAARRVVAARVEEGEGSTASQALALPVELDGLLHGVLALELRTRSEPELQSALAALHSALEEVVGQLRGTRQAEILDTEQRLMLVLDLLGTSLEETRYADACRSLVTELALRLQCDRVSLGVLRGGAARVQALSHAAEVGRRMNLTAAVAAAMDEAVDQKAVVRLPPQPGDEALVLREHERLCREHGNGSLLTVPFAGAGEFAGALVFERPAHLPFDDRELELVQSVAAVLARVLELKRDAERALFLRAGDALADQLRRLVGPRHFGRKLVVLGSLALAAFLSTATGTYRVSAPATIEGAVRRSVAAPFDGYIATAPLHAGDTASRGAILATLDEREIRLERAKWASQHGQYVKQHQEAVAQGDRAKAQITQAQFEQAEAQIALLDAQISRAALRAPFDGVIVKGDLRQSLGSAVRRGDVLFEITPLDAYRVVVNVDEREIADVLTGQRGTLVLSSITRESLAFTVGQVTAVTTAKEGRNYFRVEALLDAATPRLRPGMEGVAKIAVEERLLVWIWTRRLVHWLRLFVWTHLP